MMQYPLHYLKKRMTIVVLMLSLHLFSSNIYTFQNKNISVSKEMTIKEFLEFLSKETDYQYFYNNQLEGLSNKVNLNIQNASVEKALNIAFKNQPLEYNISGNTITIRNKVIVSTKTTTLQNNTIKGTVYDELKLPLPDVSVIVKGTTKGVVTDFDGHFEIEANKDDVLVFSYIGYKNEEVTVGTENNFEVNMQPESNQLEEIIISGVASGTSKKKMSVSVAKVSSDDLNKVVSSNISSSLQGKIAGVNISSFSGSPGSSQNIVLRGATSLSVGNNPLILIDGVQYGGTLSDINADDIENIEVVKGGAASSFYGSRAANGVIVVTSKRGKNSQNKTSITVRNEFGMQEVAKYLPLSTSHPYELALDWYGKDTYTKYAGVTYPSGYVTGWDPYITGSRVIKPDAYMDLPYRVNNDLQKMMFTRGNSMTNYVGIGGSSDKTNIFVSFENNKEQGVIVETGGYSRYGIRTNIDHKITDKLKLSTSSNFINIKNDLMGGGSGAFFDVLMMEPDVNLHKLNPDGQQFNYYPNHWSTEINNPLYNLWRNESTVSKTKLLGNYELKWKITDWLNAEASYSFDYMGYNGETYTPYGTFDGIETDTVTNIKSYSTTNGAINNTFTKNFNQVVRSTLNFSKTYNELDVNAKLSYFMEHLKTNENYTESSNFNLPNYASPNYATTHLNSDYRFEEKALDYFGIIALVYKDRYIVDGLVRYDGSSLFGPNNRWNLFNRVSLAYRLTEDVKIPGVQELKIRAARGTAGLRPGFSYQYETYNNDNGIYSKNTLGNKDLKSSINIETELGLDMSFLDRFNLEVTYSHTVNKDQFIKAPLVAAFGGFRYQWINGGTLEGENIEAMLKSKIIDNTHWKLDCNITFDTNHSEITELPINNITGIGPRGAFRYEKGVEYGTMYGYDFVTTLEQMQPQLPTGETIDQYSINVDGVVVKTADIGTVNEKAFRIKDENGTDKVVMIGNVNPDFNMGLSTNFSYKNFSFYTLWKWKNGGDIYNGTAQYLVRDLRHPMMDQIHTKPEEKKTVNYYQSLYDAQALNGYWVEDASYIRLNEASLSYTLKGEKLKEKFKIQQVKLSVTGKKLLTFTKYTSYDPEAGYDGYLFDNYGYPNFRNYAASLEIKF